VQSGHGQHVADGRDSSPFLRYLHITLSSISLQVNREFSAFAHKILATFFAFTSIHVHVYVQYMDFKILVIDSIDNLTINLNMNRLTFQPQTFPCVLLLATTLW